MGASLAVLGLGGLVFGLLEWPLSPAVRAEIEKQLPKMARAELDSASLDVEQRSAVKASIDQAFLSGFRIVVIEAAVLALVAAGFGAGVRDPLTPNQET